MRNDSIKQEIVNGDLQNPYQEFTYTLAAGVNQVIDFDFRSMRVLSVSGGAMQIQFGQTGSKTSVIGAGLGFEFPQPMRGVRVFNTGGTSMTFTLSFSMGFLQDNRLSISGSVVITNTELTPLWTDEQAPINAVYGQVSMGVAAAILLATNATRKSATFQAGTLDLFIGKTAAVTAANGLLIPAGGFFTVNNRLDVYGIRAAGTANAGYLEEYN